VQFLEESACQLLTLGLPLGSFGSQRRRTGPSLLVKVRGLVRVAEFSASALVVSLA
jgi:hypothetical protein